MLYATSYKQLSYLLFLSAAFPAVDCHLSTNNICITLLLAASLVEDCRQSLIAHYSLITIGLAAYSL